MRSAPAMSPASSRCTATLFWKSTKPSSSVTVSYIEKRHAEVCTLPKSTMAA